MLSTITTAVDFTSTLTALGTVGAAVIGVSLAVKGFLLVRKLVNRA